MRTRDKALGGLVVFVMMFSGWACNRAGGGANPQDVPDPAQDMQVSPDAGMQAAVFAGGCFWCTEAVFEQLEGVATVVSGYAGGKKDTADYNAVSGGHTDHAEVIKITYDPTKISYGQLLKVFFTVAHDPTQLNRQGPDTGKQYRSAVFYASDHEKKVVESYINQLNNAAVYDSPIVTTLEKLDEFYEAEAYHQDYVRLNPSQPYVVHQALPKVEKVKKHFADKIKDK